jgi:hypothetical protein
MGGASLRARTTQLQAHITQIALRAWACCDAAPARPQCINARLAAAQRPQARQSSPLHLQFLPMLARLSLLAAALAGVSAQTFYNGGGTSATLPVHDTSLNFVVQ